MKKIAFGLLLSSVLITPVVAQQLAPTPRAAPRTPVGRESLQERRAAPPRDLEGQALIVDGEKLRIGDTDLRLFGIVPPQLSASFGPQARAALDAVIGGGQTISCHVRDRDHDGRLLATCLSANGVDPALDLLRRGLAVAARGSIANSELAEPYISAEQAAQTAKLGLWSVVVPTAAVAPPVVAPVVIEAPKPELAKVEAPKVDSVAAKSNEVQPKTASAIMVPVKAVEIQKNEPQQHQDASGLFARYQILIAGALMLVTTLSILGAVALHRRREKLDEMKALAAALRGELMAARAVCLTRAKSIMTAADDHATTWPRIRSTLYQAYVGKLGWLGAELARQVASIYGQASDYASYYNNLGDQDGTTAMPKRQALQTLASHIEQILPRLAGIEQTGDLAAPMVYAVASQPVERPAMPKPITPMITHEVAEAKPEAEAPAAAEPTTQEKLRSVVRNLRERFVETRTAPMLTPEEYTASLEEDAERFSFSGDDEDHAPFSKLGRP